MIAKTECAVVVLVALVGFSGLVHGTGPPSGPYYLTWYTIDCGGSTSSGGPFVLRGTFGQPDAGLVTPGGGLRLTSGYWAVPIPSDGGPTCPVANCADLNSDGRRDDPCTWYECIDFVCNEMPRGSGSPGGQADLGGFAGACEVDQVCDSNDAFHAQNCFGNQGTSGGLYPCEQSPANPVYNVDAGGFAGTCVLDGTCDINDVFHAQNCFANVGTNELPPYPCQCEPGPSPQHFLPPTRPEPMVTTSLSLEGPRCARQGDVVSVDIYADGVLPRLRGYQLHVSVSGGKNGRLEVVDFAVDDERRDYAYADAQAEPWMVFNTASRQMMNGVDAAVTSTSARAYLGTVTVRVSPDAQGAFVVDVLHDEINPVPKYRTFVFATPYRPIGISATKPAIVKVVSGRPRLSIRR